MNCILCYQKTIDMKMIVLLLFLSTGIHSTFAQSKQKVQVTHKIKPSPVVIDGKLVLYYELYFNNTSGDSIIFTEIMTNDKEAILARYDGYDLAERFVNRSKKKQPRPTLAPGDSAIMYLEVLYKRTPPALDHTITFETTREGSQTIAGPRVECSIDQIQVLGPPVGRGNWVAIYDPTWLRGHRRVVFNVDGKQNIPGRFAIDFMLLDDGGKYFKGDEDLVSNWYGYDADVLAVADGTVSSVKNDFPESTKLSAHPSYPAEKATGNYVSIDIGNGKFAFYEHLKPGSIGVKPGQKIKKGEVIASLGFTGQSTGPHLHFHLANTDAPLGAEGIPFVFERFEVLGSYPDFTRFGKDKWVPADYENNLITNERPGPNTVIRF
jgi:murein DD-endopeptidase